LQEIVQDTAKAQKAEILEELGSKERKVDDFADSEAKRDLSDSSSRVYSDGTANSLIKGKLSRLEMKKLRKYIKEKTGTEIIFGSELANKFTKKDIKSGIKLKEGNFFVKYNSGSSEIHLVIGTKSKQPRGAIMEEIQHVLDEAADPLLNDRNLHNLQLHVGTFRRMAANTDFSLTDKERELLIEKAAQWERKLRENGEWIE